MKDKVTKVVLVGGGTGGHVTPLVALAGAIRQQKLAWKIYYLGAKNDNVGRNLTREEGLFDQRHFIPAGKWHRFGKASKRQLLYFWRSGFLTNLGNFFLLLLSIWQSWRYLRKIRPDLIFSKGGYVAFGPCLVARFLKIPLVTHDSDAVAGLAHKLVAKHAIMQLTGFQVDRGDRKFKHVGIPVNPLFGQSLSSEARSAVLTKYDLPEDARIILVTGGGGGAHRLNQAIISIIDQLDLGSDIYFVIVTGKNYHKEAVQALDKISLKKQVLILDFVYDMPDLLRASFGVITRAGATILTEVSLAGKATIIVPNALLPQGHQLHNARVYQKGNAAWLVSDDGQEVNLRALKQAIKEMIHDHNLRSKYQKNITKLAISNATDLTLQALKTVIYRISQEQAATPSIVVPKPAQLRKQEISKINRKKRLRVVYKNIIQYGLVLTLISGFIYKFVYISDVRLELSENSPLISKQQLADIQKNIDDFMLRDQNFGQRHFLVDLQAINSQLAEKEYIKSVQSTRKVGDSTIVILIEPRHILGYSMIEGERYIVTTDGRVISEPNNLKNQPLKLEIINNFTDLAANQLVLTPLDVEFLNQMIAYLASQGHELTQVEISVNPREIVFRLKNYDFDVIALTTADPIEQAIALNIALDFFAAPGGENSNQQGIEVSSANQEDADNDLLEPIVPEEYVDIRLINRVIYK